MRSLLFSLPGFALCLLALSFLAPGPLHGQALVTVERADSGFKFERVPLPAIDDAAAKAEIAIVAGERDRNGAEAAVLNDGQLPASDDQPSANFFFAAGTDGGRLRLDLGRTVEIGSVATYSWHPTTRGPQVYTLYASKGEGENFEAAPARDVDPTKVGWTLVAEVDTRETEGDGAQHGVLISGDADKPLGKWRNLLFDIRQTEDDRFANTFFSEIDVTDAAADPPKRFEPPKPIVKTFVSKDENLRFTVDATKAADLMPWVEQELMPDVEEWYPKMCEMMASDGFTAPDSVRIEFKDDMGGTPAYASGRGVSLSVSFFRRQLDGEAKGCVIHELVHVIQSYGRARRNDREATRTPGWVTEGVADYVRWFLYEPEKKGAEITRRNLERARYDGSYRITANFFDWVVREHHEDLLKDLNAAAREGRYSDKLWEEWTGKSLEDLGELWLAHHRERLGVEP